jgi:hypothetical protein
MAKSLLPAIADISETDQVIDQVKSLLEVLGAGEASGAKAMRLLSLSQNNLWPKRKVNEQ